jgi:putative SOS response-associated peptidase YedK
MSRGFVSRASGAPTKRCEAYTMLTTSPGPDVAPYHNRQLAVLHRNEWATWLDQEQSVKGLIGPLPEGTLTAAAV